MTTVDHHPVDAGGVSKVVEGGARDEAVAVGPATTTGMPAAAMAADLGHEVGPADELTRPEHAERVLDEIGHEVLDQGREQPHEARARP